MRKTALKMACVASAAGLVLAACGSSKKADSSAGASGAGATGGLKVDVSKCKAPSGAAVKL